MIPNDWTHVGPRPKPWWIFTVFFVLMPVIRTKWFIERTWHLWFLFALGYIAGKLL